MQLRLIPGAPSALASEHDDLQRILLEASRAEETNDAWTAVQLYREATTIVAAKLADVRQDSRPDDTRLFLRRSLQATSAEKSGSPSSWCSFENGITTTSLTSSIGEGIAASTDEVVQLASHAEQLRKEGSIAACTSCFTKVSAILERHLQQLTANGIMEERNLLMFTDTLVGIVWPLAASNPTQFVGAAATRRGRCAQMLEVLATARIEWALRCGVSLAVCVALTLSVSSPYLAKNPWACVLAVVTVKPTLGDALHTAWNVIGGGICAFFLCFPFMQIVAYQWTVPCFLAVCYFLIIFTFGDYAQARFALLVPLCGIWQQSAIVGLTSEAALRSVLTTLSGYCVGCTIGVLALALPVPRLAAPQLRQRLTEGFQLASRLHTVLVVASMQREVPHVLHLRAQAVLQKLSSCCERGERMLEHARWEPIRRATWHELKSELALLGRLRWNLQVRYDRRLVQHNVFQQSAAASLREPVHASVRAATKCMRCIVEEWDRNDVQLTRKNLLKSIRDETKCIATLFCSGATSIGSVPLVENAVACELMLLSSTFEQELVDFLDQSLRPSPRRDANWYELVVSVIKHLFPESFVQHVDAVQFPHTPRTCIWHLSHLQAITPRLMDALSTTVALILSCSLVWWPGQDSLPHLLTVEPMFCPISVIFMYQQRWHLLLRKTSRLWRWILGTYLGCIMAYWSCQVSQNQVWLLCLCLGLSACLGTVLHASDFVGFGGLCAAFTVPVICVPIWGSTHSITDRGTARLVQSITGAACLLFARLLVLPPRSIQLLKSRLAASLNGITLAARELTWAGDTPSDGPTGCRRTRRDAKWILRQKRLIPEVDYQRSLLEEALEEPFLRVGPSETDLHRAIEAIRGMWQCTLQIELMLSTFGGSGEAGALLARSQDKCTELMQCVFDTAEHMQRTLTGADTKLPTSLFQLLHSARTLTKFHLDQHGCTDFGGESDGEAEVAHDVMALGALLGRLQLLSEHTAEMTWRVVALVQKETPSTKGATDLYDFEITV